MSNALRVLGVYELLQIVADNLTLSDLASFAQVSHLVSERSLDLLWKCLPTTIPLLALFSSAVFLNGQHTLNLEKGVSAAQWKIFDKYSNRVRYISRLSSSAFAGPPDIDPTIFRKLQRLRNQPLFPQLRILSIDLRKITTGGVFSKNYIEHGSNIAPFIVPTLTRVNILGEDGQGCALAHSCLQALADVCPGLRHIRVQGEIDSIVLDDLLRFKNLEVFDSNFDVDTMIHVEQFIPPRIHQEMFHKLSSLDRLTTLLLSFHNIIPQSFLSAPPSTFLTLTRVAIKANRVEMIATLLPIMPNLEHVVIITPEFSLADSKELGRKLSLCPSVRHLEIYSFRVIGFISPSYVEPFKTQRLETLILDSYLGHGVVVSPDLICGVGSSWPNLRTLRLFPTSHVTRTTVPLISSMLALGRLCPNLNDISLGATHIPQPSRIVSFAGHETIF